MNETISVSKGKKIVSLEKERMENRDIVVRKKSHGKEFEIILKRFTEEEVEELNDAIEEVYKKYKVSGETILKRIEGIWKKHLQSVRLEKL